MALVALASAKGAPGVTTLTVALAALTPGAVAADLDPDGGDLALRYRAEDGSPLDPDLGLLSLAASLRRDRADIGDHSEPVDEHLQIASGGLGVLLGVSTPDQALGLGPLWAPLARALATGNRLIFADCGRLGPVSPALPVLTQADAVILLARTELEELAHLRERLRFLSTVLPGSREPGKPVRVGVILVAPERDRSSATRTEQLLRSSGIAVPVLGTVADDPRGAASLRGLGGRAGRSTLVRSVRSLLAPVAALAGLPTPAPVKAGRRREAPSRVTPSNPPWPATLEETSNPQVRTTSASESVPPSQADLMSDLLPTLLANDATTDAEPAWDTEPVWDTPGSETASEPQGPTVLHRSPYRPYEAQMVDELPGEGSTSHDSIEQAPAEEVAVEEVPIEEISIEDGSIEDGSIEDGGRPDEDGPDEDRPYEEPGRSTGNGWPRAGTSRAEMSQAGTSSEDDGRPQQHLDTAAPGRGH
jgi:hypothetical protein